MAGLRPAIFPVLSTSGSTFRLALSTSGANRTNVEPMGGYYYHQYAKYGRLSHNIKQIL